MHCFISSIIDVFVVINVVGFFGWSIHRSIKGAVGAISYDEYANKRTYLAHATSLFAIACGLYFFKGDVFSSKDAADLSTTAKLLIAFWTLMPPLWFGFEFYAVKSSWITASTGTQSSLAGDVKDFADFAAKIWAAFVAIYLLSLSGRIDSQKAYLDKQDKEKQASEKRLIELRHNDLIHTIVKTNAEITAVLREINAAQTQQPLKHDPQTPKPSQKP